MSSRHNAKWKEQVILYYFIWKIKAIHMILDMCKISLKIYVGIAKYVAGSNTNWVKLKQSTGCRWWPEYF